MLANSTHCAFKINTLGSPFFSLGTHGSHSKQAMCFLLAFLIIIIHWQHYPLHRDIDLLSVLLCLGCNSEQDKQTCSLFTLATWTSILHINKAPTRNDSFRNCMLATLHPEHTWEVRSVWHETRGRALEIKQDPRARWEEASDRVIQDRKGQGQAVCLGGAQEASEQYVQHEEFQKMVKLYQIPNIRASGSGSHFNILALRGQQRLNNIQGVRMSSNISSEEMLSINPLNPELSRDSSNHNEGRWPFSF